MKKLMADPDFVQQAKHVAGHVKAVNKLFSRGGVGVVVLEDFSGKNYGSISFGQVSGYIAFCILLMGGASPPR